MSVPATVIVDNYEYGRFLGAAIDSALAQTHSPTEVVVVDDGSTDESRQVIAGYGDRVVPVLKENGGQGSAVNAGFAASTGEVVCMLDADDLLAPGAVATAVAALAGSGRAKAHWPLRVVGEDGEELGRVRARGPLAGGDLRALLAERGPDAYNTAPMSGTAYSRAALERALPMPEPEYIRFADGYLSAIAPLYGEVAAVDDPQSCYRMHGGNHSKAAFDRVLEQGLAYFRATARELERHCRAAGLTPRVGDWARTSFYPRLAAAVAELDRHVPEGTPFVLVDDGLWGLGPSSGRRPMPLVVRDGVDWGPPDDAAAAIEALESRRAEGARYLAIGWTAFWWRDEYPELARELESRFERVADTDLIAVFDLGAA